MKQTTRNKIATALAGAVLIATAIGLGQPTYYPNGLIVTTPGAVIRNADITNPNGVGLIIRAENVVVDNVRVHDAKSHGILIQASNVTVKNSVITNNVTGTCYPGCSGGWESGIKCQSKDGGVGLVQNVKILNNVVHDNKGEGMGLRCADVLVQGNTVYDNFSFNIYSNSWNIVIEQNFVYCTGKNLRDGYPAAGIGGQEEGFANWPKSAHDITIRNNIVYKCKYGYRFGGAGGGVDPGLVRANIYNNTFYQAISAEISIAYAPAQADVIIQDNIARRVVYDGRGAVSWNNVDVSMQGGYDPSLFYPSQYVAGELNYPTDFFGSPRTLLSAVGAVEWLDGGSFTATPSLTSTVTATRTPTATATQTKTPAPSPAGSTRTPTITPTHATWTPSPTKTATPVATYTYECVLFIQHGQVVCLP